MTTTLLDDGCSPGASGSWSVESAALMGFCTGISGDSDGGVAGNTGACARAVVAHSSKVNIAGHFMVKLSVPLSPTFYNTSRDGVTQIFSDVWTVQRCQKIR